MKLIPDANNHVAIISLLIFIIIVLSICLIVALIDVRVTNAVCIDAVEGRFDDVIDGKLEEYMIEHYEFEVVRIVQDGNGVNIYQDGNGTILVPERIK